jgi:hypothetical protein
MMPYMGDGHKQTYGRVVPLLTGLFELTELRGLLTVLILELAKKLRGLRISLVPEFAAILG